MLTKTFACDCGCGKEASASHQKRAWFVLKQKKDDPGSNNLKLEKNLYFHSLSCLHHWLAEAMEAVANFNDSTHLSPRGVVKYDNLPGIYF